MSKSRGNTLSPQDLMKTSGADILRLWVCLRPTTRATSASGPPSCRARPRPTASSGTRCAGCSARSPTTRARQKVAPKAMPELEQLMLHRLAELDVVIREAYAAYDYKRVVAALSHFMNTDLSAFYFDIRKDALYCEPYSSASAWRRWRRSSRSSAARTLWLAPLMCFTAEEAWLARYPSEDGSVHLELFPAVPKAWRNDALPRSGSRSSACAASSPARWRSSARPSGSARRWRRRREVYHRRRRAAGGARRHRLGRGVHHLGHRHHRHGEAPEGAFTLAGRCRASAWCPSRRKARSARAPGASPRTSAAIRTSPSCPPAMPPPCASSTSAPRPRPAKVFGGSGSFGPEPRSAPNVPPGTAPAPLCAYASPASLDAREATRGIHGRGL